MNLFPNDTPAPTPAKKRRNRSPEVLTDTPDRFALVLVLPCRVLSEPNQRGHWGAKAGRAKRQRECLLYCLRELGFYKLLANCFEWPFRGFLGVVVTFTHVGPEIDDDNIRGAFKALRDQVAQWAGRNDRDKVFEWRYEQRLRSHEGEHGVEIRIEGRRDG